ncbi:16154_t:CDS:1, partial [Dentiscutata heterogama]
AITAEKVTTTEIENLRIAYPPRVINNQPEEYPTIKNIITSRRNTTIKALKNIRRNIEFLYLFESISLNLRAIQRTSLKTKIQALFQTLDLTIDHILPFELGIDNLLLETEGLNEILEGIVL